MQQCKIKLKDLFLVNQGVVSGCDYVSNRNISDLDLTKDIVNGDGIFVLDLLNSRDVALYETLSQEEKALFRPFFKNSEIGKYCCNTKNTKVLLYLDKSFTSIDKYPNIKKHLDKFEPVLMRRREAQTGAIKMFHLQWARTPNIFEGPKVVLPYRAKTNAFAYNEVEWFCRSDAYVVTPKQKDFSLKALLGILNSTLYLYWLKKQGKLKGEILELMREPIEQIQ